MMLTTRKNVYICQNCKSQIVTVDMDEQIVTPFMISCRAKLDCNGSALSLFYQVDQSLTPTWGWYKTKDGQSVKLRLLSS